MSKKPKKKSSRGNRDGPEVYTHPTESETIYDRNATFGLGPGLGFNDPFFQQPNPFTVSVSSPAQNLQGAAGTGGGDAPPNIGQGMGPMGPVFCKADYRFSAPNLRGLTNYIQAKNVMIGNNNNMNIRYNGVGFPESDSDESSSDEGPVDLQEEVERKRKEEERYEKKAQFHETLHSSRPISPEEMRAVSKCLLGAWRKFLRYLDIEDELLDKYYQDYMPNGGLAEVVYQSLDYWRRNTDSPEVQKVANALGRVNMWDTVSDHLHP